jgi:hypothetical protein
MGHTMNPADCPFACAARFDNARGRGTGAHRLVRIGRGAQAVFLLSTWLWASGCEAVGLPHGARRFTAPAQYRAWWALTEACSGLHGDFNSIAWYVTPNTETFSLEGMPVQGAWYPDPSRIVLGDMEIGDGSLVRHEMLHALLKGGKHPRQQFLGNCGDIVICVGQCLIDAGGPPDAPESAPIISASLLPAAIVIVPDTVSIAADSGWVTITVTLTNTTDQPARAPTIPNESFPITLVTIHPIPGWAGISQDQLDYYVTLAPRGTIGSTRRDVLDQQITSVNTPPQYVITGTFGDSPATAQVLTVIP